MRDTMQKSGLTEEKKTEDHEDDDWLAEFLKSEKFFSVVKIGTFAVSLYVGAAATLLATIFFQFSTGIVAGIAVFCGCLAVRKHIIK